MGLRTGLVVVALLGVRDLLLELHAEVLGRLRDDRERPHADVGCDDVGQAEAHEPLVLVHDDLKERCVDSLSVPCVLTRTECDTRCCFRLVMLKRSLPCGS